MSQQVKQLIENTVVDEQGNVVNYTRSKTVRLPEEPQYIKLYIEDLLYLSDLPKGHENILFHLLTKSSYAGDTYGMVVSISKGMKEIICEELKLENIRTINNVLSDLTKGKILKRIKTGLYQFNPYLFGKGSWEDISKLRLEIGYDELTGRTFKTYIENERKKDRAREETNEKQVQYAIEEAKRKREENEQQTEASPNS